MLTEKEKEWLERRKNLCNRCIKAAWCRTGEKHGYNTERCRFWELKVPNQSILLGALSEDLHDAAEFEARVAANLAIDRANGKHLRPKGCSWYETAKDGQRIRKTACPPHHDIDKCAGFATCSLYLARLAAEAEMDNTAGSK